MADNLKEALNEANPNNAADLMRGVKLGDALASGSIRSLKSATVASHILSLDEDAKAIAILAAYSVAGTLTGALTPLANPGGAPATTEIGITPDGNILCAAADAVTSLDVLYLSPDADVEEFVLNVVASAAALPSGKKAWIITEVEVTTGLVLGSKTIIARGGTPSAGEACIADDGATIDFNATDVVAGVARVRALVARTQGMTEKLALTSGF